MTTERSRLGLITIAVLLAVVAAPVLSVTVAAQPAGPGSNGSNSTGPGSSVGEAVPTSCEAVQANPASSGPSYRVVSGSCTVTLSDGEVLSNVWFKGGGSKVEVNARGSGWTIRNVAITNNGAADHSVLNLQVNARDGLGLVSNVWISDSKGNAVFIHPKHAGEIKFHKFSCVDISEDCAYASRPGNPPSITTGDEKIEGNEGIVGFSKTFVKDVGHGPEVGYGLRIGSDGSFIRNSTIVNTGGPAVANTFASGQNPKQHPRAFVGVLVQNVDIVQPKGSGAGVRLNNHQNRIIPKRQWTAITKFVNVAITAGSPLDENRAGGEGPVIRGSYNTGGGSTEPPPGAPHSPERAASGIGGGTGSIGSAVVGEEGDSSGSGVGGGVIGAIIAPIVLVPLIIVALTVLVGGALSVGLFAALKPP